MREFQRCWVRLEKCSLFANIKYAFGEYVIKYLLLVSNRIIHLFLRESNSNLAECLRHILDDRAFRADSKCIIIKFNFQINPCKNEGNAFSHRTQGRHGCVIHLRSQTIYKGSWFVVTYPIRLCLYAHQLIHTMLSSCTAMLTVAVYNNIRKGFKSSPTPPFLYHILLAKVKKSLYN